MRWFWKTERAAEPDKGACKHSPAYALARSLTDPETRDEWTRTGSAAGLGVLHYVNKSRELTVSRYYLYGESVVTPFTLNGAEKRIVLRALHEFEDRRRRIKESAALSRLLAPASAIEAPSGGETSTKIEGSTEGESAVPEGETPK